MAVEIRGKKRVRCAKLSNFFVFNVHILSKNMLAPSYRNGYKSLRALHCSSYFVTYGAAKKIDDRGSWREYSKENVCAVLCICISFSSIVVEQASKAT